MSAAILPSVAQQPTLSASGGSDCCVGLQFYSIVFFGIPQVHSHASLILFESFMDVHYPQFVANPLNKKWMAYVGSGPRKQTVDNMKHMSL